MPTTIFCFQNNNFPKKSEKKVVKDSIQKSSFGNACFGNPKTLKQSTNGNHQSQKLEKRPTNSETICDGMQNKQTQKGKCIACLIAHNERITARKAKCNAGSGRRRLNRRRWRWRWRRLTPKIHSICIVHQHSASVGDDGERLGAKVSRDRRRQMREQMRFQIRGPLVLFASLGSGFQIKWGWLGCHWAFFSLLFSFFFYA